MAEKYIMEMLTENAMSEKTIAVLTASAPLVRQYSNDITTIMYSDMVTNYPEVKNILSVSSLKPGIRGEPAPLPRALANALIFFAENCTNLGNMNELLSRIIHKHVSFTIMPEHYPIVRKCILGAIKEVLGASATDEVIQGWSDAYSFLARIVINAEARMRGDYALLPGGWVSYRPLTVTQKIVESSNVISFLLTPTDMDSVMKFIPGQFMSIKIPKEKLQNADHDFVSNYYISCKSGLNHFKISMQLEKYESSMKVISDYMNKKVQVNDTILVSPPCGKFSVDTSNNKPIVFIGEGVGCGCFVSMLDQIMEEQPNRSVTFIQIAKDKDRHPFAKQIDAAASRCNVSYHVFFTDFDAKQPQGLSNISAFYNSNFDANKIKSIMKDNYDKAIYYYLGSAGFMSAVKTNLTLLKIPKESMITESFGPLINA